MNIIDQVQANVAAALDAQAAANVAAGPKAVTGNFSQQMDARLANLQADLYQKSQAAGHDFGADAAAAEAAKGSFFGDIGRGIGSAVSAPFTTVSKIASGENVFDSIGQGVAQVVGGALQIVHPVLDGLSHVPIVGGTFNELNTVSRDAVNKEGAITPAQAWAGFRDLAEVGAVAYSVADAAAGPGSTSASSIAQDATLKAGVAQKVLNGDLGAIAGVVGVPDLGVDLGFGDVQNAAKPYIDAASQFFPGGGPGWPHVSQAASTQSGYDSGAKPSQNQSVVILGALALGAYFLLGRKS